VGLAGVSPAAIAPDMPGFGKADKPRSGYSYTVAGYGEHLGAALEQLGIKRVHLVLHDFGGAVGLAWGAASPDQLASVVLIDTGVLRGYRWHYLARIWRTPIGGDLFMAGRQPPGLRPPSAPRQPGRPPQITRPRTCKRRQGDVKLLRASAMSEVAGTVAARPPGCPSRQSSTSGRTNALGRPPWLAVAQKEGRRPAAGAGHEQVAADRRPPDPGQVVPAVAPQHPGVDEDDRGELVRAGGAPRQAPRPAEVVARTRCTRLMPSCSRAAPRCSPYPATVYE